MIKHFISVLTVLIMIMTGVAAQDDNTTDQPFLGVTFQINDDGQPIIHRLVGEGPADEAGLERGDIITAIDGNTVTGDDLIETILTYAPDEVITLTVQRGDESLDIDVTLGVRPQQTSRGENYNHQPQPTGFIGIQLENTDQGVVIADVLEGTPAATAGLQTGDIILAINGTDVGDMGGLLETMNDFSPDETITISIERDGEQQEVEVTLTAHPNPMQSSMRFSDDEIDLLLEEGVLQIIKLSENSPLTAAGLLEGDRITAINGQALDMRNIRGLGNLLGRDNTAESVTLTIERADETLEIDVDTFLMVNLITNAMRGSGAGMPFVLPIPPMADQNMPPFAPSPPQGHFEFRQSPVRLGVLFITLDENMATARNLDVTEGAYITEVEPDSPAEISGLQVGDVITAVNDATLDFEHNLAVRLQNFKPGDSVTLDVFRNGETLQLDVTLEQVPSRTNAPSEQIPDHNF